MDKSRKVHQEYQIDESLLQELAFKERKGDFFEKSLKFYNEVKDKELRFISDRQKNWLWEISSILHDRQQSKIEHQIHKASKRTQKQEQKQGFVSKIIDKLYKIFG